MTSVSAKITISLTNFTIEDNTMNGGSMVYFEQYSNVSLSASAFQRNVGERGTCLCANSGLNLTVWGSKFVRNSSPVNIGGVLAFTLSGDKLLRAEVFDCSFALNSATEGGVITFSTQKVLTFDLLLYRNTFANNTATQKAAVLSIQELVALSNASTIDSCTFANNESPYGAISTMQFSGTFPLTNSRFTNNAGNVAAALHIESQPSGANLLQNLTFENSRNGPALLKTNSRVASQVTSINCVFQNNAKGAVTFEGGIWFDQQSWYTGSMYRGISLTMGTNATILWSNFTRNVNSLDHGGGAYLASQSVLYCERCLFSGNLAILGGAIYSEQDSIVLLNLSRVEGNRAVKSGSALALITSLNSVSRVTASNFTNNTSGENSFIVGQNAVFILTFIIVVNF